MNLLRDLWHDPTQRALLILNVASIVLSLGALALVLVAW